MKDGRTRKLPRSEGPGPEARFLASHRVSLTLLSGPQAGTEVLLDKARVIVGRGPGVDLSFDDAAVSSRHAAFELEKDQFHVRDLGSTNGVLVNGGAVRDAALKHRDQVQLGSLAFRYLMERRAAEPQTYVVDED